MNTNWKTTISGAFNALGTTLMGVGIIPQLSGTSSKFLMYVAITGFICKAVAEFLGHLFAADASQLKDIANQVSDIKQQQSSNTDFIAKQQVGQTTK